MTVVYNKVTNVWDNVSNTASLSSDWIINPVFVNEARANSIDPKYWTFSGSTIDTLTDAQIAPLIVADKQASVWAQIQAIRDYKTGGGIHLAGSGYWFNTDPASRIQYLALMMLGANMPAGIMWKTMTGAFVQMTPSLVTQVFGTLVQSDQTIFAHAETLKAQMMASADPSLFDFTAGWQTVYADTLV